MPLLQVELLNWTAIMGSAASKSARKLPTAKKATPPWAGARTGTSAKAPPPPPRASETKTQGSVFLLRVTASPN